MEPTLALTVNRPSVIFDVQGDETVIIDLTSGHYFRLDGAATVFWRRFVSPTTGAELLDTCSNAQDLEPVIADIIDDLVSRGLLRGAIESDGPSSVTSTWQFSGFALEQFTDLEDILGLDPIHEVDTARGWPHAADG